MIFLRHNGIRYSTKKKKIRETLVQEISQTPQTPPQPTLPKPNPKKRLSRNFEEALKKFQMEDLENPHTVQPTAAHSPEKSLKTLKNPMIVTGISYIDSERDCETSTARIERLPGYQVIGTSERSKKTRKNLLENEMPPPCHKSYKSAQFRK